MRRTRPLHGGFAVSRTRQSVGGLNGTDRSHYCVLFSNRGAVLASAANSSVAHAEARAIREAQRRGRGKRLRGCTAVVVRCTLPSVVGAELGRSRCCRAHLSVHEASSADWKLSRCCAGCERLLRTVGCVRMVYTHSAGLALQEDLL